MMIGVELRAWTMARCPGADEQIERLRIGEQIGYAEGAGIGDELIALFEAAADDGTNFGVIKRQ